MVNFSELGLNEEREIRCLVTQGLNKKIKVYYNDFDNIKNKIGQKIVTVYETNEEDRDLIIDLINEGIKKELESGRDVDKKNIGIDAIDFIVVLLQRLTDINLDIDVTDIKSIEKIIKKPTNLLLAIHKEINTMCNYILDSIYENMVSFADRPEGVRQFLLSQYHKDQLEKEKSEASEGVDEVIESGEIDA